MRPGSLARSARTPARVCVACIVALACTAIARAPLALASAPRALTASPYEYLGWGDPPAPASVLATTGLHDLTLAFILSRGRCNPAWDGWRPLAGGADQRAIEAIRAAGGDVAVSFGGWSGRKLGSSCRTAAALARAYQQVIDAYALRAIDIDIEHTEFASARTRRRVAQALASVQAANPRLEISITMPTEPAGPDADGRSLIAAAAAAGLEPSAWTVMPFDFGRPIPDMGRVSIEAAEGLARDLAAAYHITIAQALRHSGISSMNGRTDEGDETVSIEDLQHMLAFAQASHLARLTFWAVNRDRECGGANTSADACSGVAQQPYAYSEVVAQYRG